MDRRIRPAILGLLAALALAPACQEYVFEPVRPAMITVSNHHYKISDTAKADILFVVDDSCSMEGEQTNLATNFGAFINTIEQANQQRTAKGQKPIDYRIAVTNTSVTQNAIYPDGSKHKATTYSAGGAGCASAYDLTGQPYPAGKLMAVPGNQAILDSSTMTDAQITQQFEQNVRFGTCGSGQEQGLLAAKLALTKNPDFVRKDAKLLIVIISDEEDCSDPNNDVYVGYTTDGDECVHNAGLPNGGLLGPVSGYTDFFKNANPEVALGVIVSANRTVDPSTGAVTSVTPAVCTDPQCNANCPGDPTGISCYCGGTTPGSRYLKAADQVSGSLKDSICQDDFSKTLQALADIIAVPDRIKLDAHPHNDDPSLVLLEITRADGTQIVCKAPKAGQTCADGVDWSYDPNGPYIQLCNNPNSDCKLEPGDTYVVSFVESACSTDQPCQ